MLTLFNRYFNVFFCLIYDGDFDEFGLEKGIWENGIYSLNSNRVLATNSNFIIPIFLEPDGVGLIHFNPTEFILWYIKDLLVIIQCLTLERVV